MDGKYLQISSQFVLISRIDMRTILCPSLACLLLWSPLVCNWDVSVRCTSMASPKDLQAFFRPSAVQAGTLTSTGRNPNFHSHCSFLWSFSQSRSYPWPILSLNVLANSENSSFREISLHQLSSHKRAFFFARKAVLEKKIMDISLCAYHSQLKHFQGNLCSIMRWILKAYQMKGAAALVRVSCNIIETTTNKAPNTHIFQAKLLEKEAYS